MTDSGALVVVRHLIEEGVITVADLDKIVSEVTAGGQAVPTHAEFVVVVRKLCPPRSLSTYNTGFNRLVGRFGERRVDSVTAFELTAARAEVEVEAAQDARGRGGQGAGRNFVSAEL